MNKKKIALSLMGLSAIGIIPLSEINANANAGMDLGINPSNTTYRPAEGYINAGSWYKNPWSKGEAGGYLNDSGGIGGSSMYYRDRTKVVNEKYSKYGFDVYYYKPQGYSAQWQSVPENKYNYTKKMSWFKEGSYHKWFGNENRNFSKWENNPNLYDFNAWNGQYQSSTYRYSTDYDSYHGVNGTWRFLGYNMAGNVVENPMFPPDGLSRSYNSPATTGIINIRIHGRTGPNVPVPNSYKQSTMYDNNVYYARKVQAIEKMMNASPHFKNARIKQFKSTTPATWNTSWWKYDSAISAQEWAECISLQTHPTLDTPVFNGYLINNGNTFSYTSMIAPAPELNSDLSVEEIRVYRDTTNELVGRFTRNNGNDDFGHKITPGNNYRFEYVVKNVGANDMKMSEVRLDTGFSTNASANQNGQENAFPENNSGYNSTLKANRKLRVGETTTLTRKTSVPDDVRNAWKGSAYINKWHMETMDNLFASNDWGFVRYNKVALGDFSAEDIYYEDVNGNKVDKIIPGEKYKVCYEFGYTGETMDEPQDLDFEGKVTRYLPQEGGSSETKTYKFNSKNVTLKKGMANLVYKTDYIVFEQPKVSAIATVKIQNEVINSNASNDNYSESFNDSYDYSISNVRVLPSNDKPVKDGNITVGVKYDINLKAPSYTNSKEYDVTTHIKLPSGVTIPVVDHIKTGTTKDIVHEVQIPVTKLNSGSKDYKIDVLVNADRKKWEDDLSTLANNKGTGNLQILAPNNPTDFVNNTGCAIGTGDTNKWSVNHTISSYEGNYVTYDKFSGRPSYSFYNFKPTGSYVSTKNYTENYNIDNVLFKSKFTVDNKFGTNGWVDLTNSAQRDKAKIKAGYGYELEINVTYKNNVFATQPTASWNRSGNYITGTTVSNLQTQANINNDIYVRTPDGKTLSATGMYGTIQAFDSKVLKNTKDEVKIRYTMKTKNNNGVSEPLKIFINENVKDGSYGLNVFTPTMKGVGSTTSKPDLCDYEKLGYKVQGSMHDDNSDHIVQ